MSHMPTIGDTFMNEIVEIKNKWEKELLKIPGVNGVGISADSKQRYILVTLQTPPTPKITAEIPTTIEGIPVKYKYVGKITLLSWTGRYRPVVGGVSTGPLHPWAGTFGCLVRDAKTGEIYGISNNHVWAADMEGLPNMAEKGEPIIQPGVVDGGTIADQIGTLEKWIPVKKDNNYVDAALMKPSDPTLVSPEVKEIGKPLNPVEPEIGDVIRKAGRTTELTYGKVESNNYTVDVCEPETNVCWTFYDTVFASPTPPSTTFVEPGDSGSSSFQYDLNGVIGLVFAGSEAGDGVICKAKHITKLLNVYFLAPTTPPYLPVISFMAPFTVVLGTANLLTGGKILR